MSKKSIALCALLALTTLAAVAHEFWLLPKKWFVETGEPVQIQVRVGENFEGERWGAGASRVTRFVSILKKEETDRLPLLQKNGIENLSLTFEKVGTQLIALATNSKYLELEAEKFDAYLIEDGLEHIRLARKKMGQTDRPGREFYRREAATLLQVGKQATPVFFKKTGFDLQILPEKNPLLADLPSTADLRFQIRFRGKPLAGAKVRHWQKDAATGKVEVQMQVSDRRGRVSFRLSSGEQMVSVVHMIPHSVPSEADWQSIWGNLTFCRP